MSSRLFSSLNLRELTLPNRIVVSPMAQYSAGPYGLSGDWHMMHVGNLLVSGAGLVIMEATAVEPRGRVSPECLGLWNDEQAQGLKALTAFRDRHHGAALGIQLAHAGRKASVSVPWKGQRPLSVEEGGWDLVAASATPYPGRSTPEALSRDDLRTMIAHYVDATRRAEDAGFDLIELHCAHGYLLNSFLSPLSNHRTDEYGGSLENRMRFPLEVFHAVRDAWPAHKPLGVRISATDWIDAGWGLDSSVAFAQALKALGCDYIAASSGGVLPEQNIPVGPGYQVPLAKGIREGAQIVTLAVGLINQPDEAQEILLKGDADLIAIGRGMTYEPRWAWHAAAHLGEQTSYPPQYARSHPSMRSGDPLKAFRATN